MIDLAHLERLAKEGTDEALIMFTNAHGGKRNTILSLISMIRQARNEGIEEAAKWHEGKANAAEFVGSVEGFNTEQFNLWAAKHRDNAAAIRSLKAST